MRKIRENRGSGKKINKNETETNDDEIRELVLCYTMNGSILVL